MTVRRTGDLRASTKHEAVLSDYRAKAGFGASLHDFHDRLLCYGSTPFSVVGPELLADMAKPLTEVATRSVLQFHLVRQPLGALLLPHGDRGSPSQTTRNAFRKPSGCPHCWGTVWKRAKLKAALASTNVRQTGEHSCEGCGRIGRREHEPTLCLICFHV
jgi:hypothetical protein